MKNQITKSDSHLLNEIQGSDTDSSLTIEYNDSVGWRSHPKDTAIIR